MVLHRVSRVVAESIMLLKISSFRNISAFCHATYAVNKPYQPENAHHRGEGTLYSCSSVLLD